MANHTLSRRSFSKFLATGATYAALQSRDQVRASLRSTAPIVRLSSNENPYGPSPAALKAMTDGFGLAWRYPDEYADMLAEELARLHGVPSDQVLLGDGSGEILKLCASAFTSREKKLVIANPTHYAIALRYRRDENPAPLVLAKGADAIALKIRAVAEQNNIPATENKELARPLYEAVSGRPGNTERVLPARRRDHLLPAVAAIAPCGEGPLNSRDGIPGNSLGKACGAMVLSNGRD